MTLFNTYPKAGVERDGSSITNYYERRGAIPAFSSLSIYRFGNAIVGQPGSTVRDPITQVSPEFFTTLGVGPVKGRVFTDAEMTVGADHVVILGNDYWRQHFNADAHILGQNSLDRQYPMKPSLVSCLPVFVFSPAQAQLYLPLSSQPRSAYSAAAPLRRQRDSDDCAAQTRRDHHGSTSPDRRAKYRASNETIRRRK